jgi:hypothetical protein
MPASCLWPHGHDDLFLNSPTARKRPHMRSPVDAVAKLKGLYETRDKANEQIQAVEQLFGAEPVEPKKRKHLLKMRFRGTFSQDMSAKEPAAAL